MCHASQRAREAIINVSPQVFGFLVSSYTAYIRSQQHMYVCFISFFRCLWVLHWSQLSGWSSRPKPGDIGAHHHRMGSAQHQNSVWQLGQLLQLKTYSWWDLWPWCCSWMALCGSRWWKHPHSKHRKQIEDEVETEAPIWNPLLHVLQLQ